MVQLLIAMFFAVGIIGRYFADKSNLSWMVVFSLVSPYIAVGSESIDSMYIMVLLTVACVALKKKGKIKWVYNKRVTEYSRLLCAVMGVYMIAWILFSRRDFMVTLKTILGLAKLLMFVILSLYMNNGYDKETQYAQLRKGVYALIIVNAFASVVQLNSVSYGIMIVEAFGRDNALSLLPVITQWGRFSRCFGIMDTPMSYGIFSVLALFFIINDKNQRRPVVKYIMAALSMFCGIASASKSFLLGCVLVLAIKILIEFPMQKQKKALWGYLGVLVVVVLVVSMYDRIGEFIRDNFGSTYLYIWEFLSKPMEAFATRYSDDAELMGDTVDVIKEYWLLGVGPSSIKNERAIDSAFMNILHNGGVITLMIVLIYYARLAASCWKNKSILCIGFLILILFLGFGFQTWIAIGTAWPLVFVLLSDCGAAGISTPSLERGR